MIVGDLEIRLRADIARLQQDLNGARREVGGAMQNIERSVNIAKAAFAALAGAFAMGSLAGMISDVRRAAVDIERMAAMAGSTTDEFQRFAAGSATVGIEMDKFSDIVKDVQDRIGDFLVTGGGEMTDFFEKIAPRVGITIEHFKNLSGPQALQLFYTTLERANVGQAVMIQQMESLASDASMLAPLLAHGGAAFKRIGDDAEAAGFIMKQALIDASKIWAMEIQTIQTYLGGIGRTIATFIIPQLAEMSVEIRQNIAAGFQEVMAWVEGNKKELIGTWNAAKAVGLEVLDIAKGAALVSGWLVKIGLQMGFFRTVFEAVGLMVAGLQDGIMIMAASLSALVANTLSQVRTVIQAIGSFQKFIGRTDAAKYFTDTAAEIRAVEDEITGYGAGIVDEFATGGSAVQKYAEALGKVKPVVLDLAESTRAALKGVGDGSGAMAKAAAAAAAAATAAAATAKKNMESDIAGIKAASEQAVGIYTSAEQIMESVRAGGLIEDAEYYASKLGFINLAAMAQESALVAQIARLEREKLAGDDKIEHDRKIAEARAGLSKVLADAVVARIINGNEEANANRMTAKSYADAESAAKAYLDTVARQSEREIAGIGRGTQFREYQGSVNAIEDRQTGTRQGLENDKRNGLINQETFDRHLAMAGVTASAEIEINRKKFEDIRLLQGDWTVGAAEAFANYQSNAENVAASSAQTFTSAFEGMTDGVANSLTAAILHGQSFEESMKAVALNVVESFIQSFIKIAIQQLFTQNAMTVATLAGVTTRAGVEAGGAATSLALSAATAQKSIMMSAWETMASAYKAIAGIPIVGPFLAPVAAGTAFVAVAAIAKNIASAEGGYDIPAGVNPMTQLHAQEMVLPKAQANVIRNLASEGGTKSGAITIINQTSSAWKATETKLSNGDRALIIQEASEKASKSAIAATSAQMSDPNSQTSRSMARNFNIPRSR
jgi:lambda family phage tail tape measure protein